MDTRVVYEDFVPSYKLVPEEGIVVELPEFKKEQVRVQLENFGKLSISGERPLADNRRSRFSNVFEFPEDCNETRFRFENGRLYVKVLPKSITETASMEAAIKIKETRLKDQPTQVQKPNEIQKPTDQLQKPSIRKDDTNQKATPTPSVEVVNVVPKKQEDEKRGEPAETRKDSEKVVDKLVVPESDLVFSKPMQILVNVIVALAVLVVMALYVTSKK